MGARERDEAAGLIRRHLWKPRPPGPTKDGRAWTMARELGVWTQLARVIGAENLNGAIPHARLLTGATGPMRMTWFLNPRNGPQLLARAVAAGLNSLPTQPPRKRGGGFERLTFELPEPRPEVGPCTEATP